MIPYVEIRNNVSSSTAQKLKTFALIEPSQCWFEISYYDIGQFELYCQADAQSLKALKKGNFVSLPNEDYLWIITRVQYEYTTNGTRMISATGYEAKWIIGKRIILTPWQLPATLGSAVYQLIYTNLGEGAKESARKIPTLSVRQQSISTAIDMQATRGNLLDFLQPILKSNKLGCAIRLTDSGMEFSILQGQDRSQSVIFSQSLDNLLSCSYETDDEDKKSYCQVTQSFDMSDGSRETYITRVDQGATGIDRSEMTIGSNVSLKYTDSEGREQETEAGSTLYMSWLREEGQSTLSENTSSEEVTGEIDLEHSIYQFGVDFDLGDIIKISDEFFGIQMSPRIVKVTFKQDASGYGQEIEYATDEITQGS